MSELRLDQLLGQCTVRVSGRTRGRHGTGFFVAPGLILTCAHVVGDDDVASVKARWQDEPMSAALIKRVPDLPARSTVALLPDLALLRVASTEHPCVLLDQSMQLTDRLYSYGYPERLAGGDSLLVEFEGDSADPDLLKVTQGQVSPGFSGAPLLNLRTGGVCGMIKSSRHTLLPLGGRAIPTSTILAHFGELAALQEEFHRSNGRWLSSLSHSQWASLRGGAAPESRDISEGAEVVAVEVGGTRRVTIEFRLPETPPRPTKGFVKGPLDSQLLWLAQLIQSEESVAVTIGGDDPVAIYMSGAVERFFDPAMEPPAVTLALGSPTSEPNKWPQPGVYQSSPDTTPPKLIEAVSHQADEALFMWLVALAYRAGRMTELDEYLNACPKEVSPRLYTLRQKHWLALRDDEINLTGAHGPLTADPSELGSEVLTALVAAQVKGPAKLLAAARRDFAKEDHQALASKLRRLEKGAGTQSTAVRAEITLMQAMLDLARNRLREVEDAINTLTPLELPAPLRLGLALLLLSKGEVLRARALIAQGEPAVGEQPAAHIIARLINIWAATVGGSVLTGADRQKQAAEFEGLCHSAKKLAGTQKAVALFVAHMALRLNNVEAAADLLDFAGSEYQGTVEFMHLSALVDIHRVLKYRSHNPDRGFGKPERAAVNRCIATLESCIALAHARQLSRPLPSLYTNLGVALHLKSSLSTGEVRRQEFRKSAEALHQAAAHAVDGVELSARAANAWLLAGDAARAAEEFGRLSVQQLPADLQSNYAAALLMSGQPAKAIKILQALSRQKVMSWQMLSNLAIVLLVTGQPSAAITALDLARPVAGQGRWRVDYLLGKTFLKLGQARNAETCLRLAIEHRSFEPRLYSEHLYCFRQGTVRDLNSLIEKLARVLEAKKVNKSVLEELQQQGVHALDVYQESVRKYGGRKAQAGGLVTYAFTEALDKSDALNKKLRALEATLAARQVWPENALIDQIREIAFEKFEAPHRNTPAAHQDGPAGESAIELQRLVSAAERLLDTCRVPVSLRPESVDVLNSLENGGGEESVGHMLAVAARVIANSASEPLKCYDHVEGVEHKGFQRRVVHHVFNEMHGRAILADEVGLGKTIEAGLLLTEYRVRRLVKRCLVLVPTADLKEQWLSELTSKFKLAAGSGENSVAIHGSRHWRGWEQHTVCITSYAAAVNNAQQVRSAGWGMIIADEAHHLRNRSSSAFKLLARLRTRYLLLLTATPFQKSIEDLYSLATLVRPSLFGTLKRFRAEFGRASDEKPRNDTRLKALLYQIMVGNTIISVAGEMPTSRREFRNPNVHLSPSEMEFYQKVISLVLTEAGRNNNPPLTYYLLAREASSSPATALHTLRTLLARQKHDAQFVPPYDFEALAGDIETRSKVAEVERIVDETAPRKVLLFAEFRATAVELGRLLGADVVHGGLRTAERLQIIKTFRADPRRRVLVVTPAQGEGLNLEFCSVVINYDLPWNPMRIEQRIGRVQRVGQKEKVVTIYSLASLDTIEEVIRDGLVRKIAIFQRLIGDISLEFKAEKDSKGLESHIHQLFRYAENEKALRESLVQFFDEDGAPVVVDQNSGIAVAEAPVNILGIP
jgi:superfamily II DNA or RNA helicase/tetratricopeptide (TPR) repeat protein